MLEHHADFAPDLVNTFDIVGKLDAIDDDLSGLMLLAVPVAAWGAWRLLKVVGRFVDPLGLPRWLVVWGALTYALVPVTSGAWGEGRFGTVAVAALLPWAAHAALGFVDPDRDRRW